MHQSRFSLSAQLYHVEFISIACRNFTITTDLNIRAEPSIVIVPLAVSPTPGVKISEHRQLKPLWYQKSKTYLHIILVIRCTSRRSEAVINGCRTVSPSLTPASKSDALAAS